MAAALPVAGLLQAVNNLHSIMVGPIFPLLLELAAAAVAAVMVNQTPAQRVALVDCLVVAAAAVPVAQQQPEAQAGRA